MSDSLIDFLTVLAATGSGIVAGIFFAFSVFVMKALGELPYPLGMRTMQRINKTIITPLFLLVFLGTGVICALLILTALFDPPSTGRWDLVAGTLNYLVGAILVTAVFNVPRNNVLDALDDSLESEEAWHVYQVEWTTVNHIRTALTTVAAVLLVVSLI